jgi:hypothetical protein
VRPASYFEAMAQDAQRRARGARRQADERYTIGRLAGGDDDRPTLRSGRLTSGIDKLEVYRKLGVREVWFYERGSLKFLSLRGACEHRPIPRSTLLPARQSSCCSRACAAEPTAPRVLRSQLHGPVLELVLLMRGVTFVVLVGLLAGVAQAQPAVDFIASTAAHDHAARTYRSIWAQDGPRIVAALEARTCMRFPEQAVAALIGDEVSHSGGPEHPMGLRASYDVDVKRATLVHELAHRHLWQLMERLDGVDGHRTLYLVLERVWADVWGEQFATERIGTESAWRAGYDYAAAWAWARNLTIDERGILWNRLLALNGKPYCHTVYVDPKFSAERQTLPSPIP